MNNKSSSFYILALFVLFLSAGIISTFGTEISAEFQPKDVLVGETAIYKITLPGNPSALRPTLPQLKGIDFYYMGAQHRNSIINGQISSSTSFIYKAIAIDPGTYTVPEFNISIDGINYIVPSTTLNASEVPNSKNYQSEAFGLTLDTPKETLYVGETVPVKLTFFIQTNLSGQLLENFPTQDTDAFSVNTTNQAPHQQVIVRNNVQYHEVIWNNTITPLKTGQYDLQFHILAQVQSNSNNRPNNPFIHPFGSLLDDMLTEYRQVNLSTEEKLIQVHPLPIEGKPTNFSGAIGEFAIQQTITTDTIEVGEPLSLTVNIIGQGNFDRIQAPDPDSQDEWKAYEPNVTFTPMDSTGYKGTKTIEYVLIPKTDTITQTPNITLEYFNPETHSYEKATAYGKDITVTSSSALTPPVQTKPSSHGVSHTLENDKLLPIITHAKLKTTKTYSYEKSPIFWTIQALALALLAGGLYVRKKQLRLMQDPHYANIARSRKALKKELKKAQTAASKNHIEEFFSACEQTIKHALGAKYGKRTESLTFEEIKSMLDAQNMNSGYIETIKEFFVASDALRFGGKSQADPDLKKSLQKLETLIKNITQKSL